MQVHTLKNKLRVVLVPMEGLRSVTVMAMVGVGSRFETKPKGGVSHFFEHMVFKGSNKWPEAFDLSAAVDGIGADFNAFTSKEYTGFYITTTEKHLKFAMDIISDMLYTPKLRGDDLEREKGVIIEEINMYADLPQHRVADIFDAAIYGDHGLGRDILGSRHTVKTLERKDFKHHLQTWYGLDNTCVVVAGDASAMKNEGKLLKQIEEYFDKGQVYGETTEEKVMGYREVGDVDVTVHCKECDQAHFILGFPSYALDHPDRYALSLLSIIVGGNMSSRLFTEVREKRGLAYYARADVDRFMDTGSFSAVEGVDVNRVDDAINVTLEVFKQIVDDGKKGITAEEMTRAKEFLAGQLQLSLERSRNVAQYWAQRVVLGDDILTPEAVLDKIRAVDHADVVRVAQDVINPAKMVFALIGPYDDNGRFGELLKFEI